ncbi:MAG: OmpA family protein, partial [Fimbriimonadaceae bacterium]
SVPSAPKSDKLFAMPGSPASKSAKKYSGNSDEAVARDEESLKRMAATLKRELGTEKELQELVKSVDFTLTNDGLRIELVESAAAVFFENGEAKIRPNAMKLIQKIAPIIVKSHRRIIVEGHTDARPYPSLHYTNWDLSTDRASSLRRALTKFGVPLSQFEQVRGYADTQPKVPDDPYHFSNRRVTLLLPFRPVNDTQIALPAEAFREEIQGVFRRPVILAPNRPKAEGFREIRPAGDEGAGE